jgi:hypothetical protein
MVDTESIIALVSAPSKFSSLEIYSYVWHASLIGLKSMTIKPDVFIKSIKMIDNHFVKAVNCSFGHYALPDYQHLIKTKKKKKKVSKGKRPRVQEGDGTAFRNSIEFTVYFDKAQTKEEAELMENIIKYKRRVEPKDYKIKFFPRTGTIQLTGGVLRDFSDGRYAMESVVDFLNKQEFYTDKIEMVNGSLTMVNTGCYMLLNDHVIDINKLYNKILSINPVFDDYIVKRPELDKNHNNFSVIFMTKAEDASGKTEKKKRKVSIRIYRSGKFNSLGSPSLELSQFAYDFMINFMECHNCVVKPLIMI